MRNSATPALGSSSATATSPTPTHISSILFDINEKNIDTAPSHQQLRPDCGTDTSAAATAAIILAAATTTTPTTELLSAAN